MSDNSGCNAASNNKYDEFGILRNAKGRKVRDDKGSKRKYVQKVRAERKKAKDLQRTLFDIEKMTAREAELAERALKPKKNQKTDAQLQRERRLQERIDLLQKYVPLRICVLCNKKHYQSKAWVFLKFQKKMICKGCYKRIKDLNLGKSQTELDEMLTFVISVSEFAVLHYDMINFAISCEKTCLSDKVSNFAETPNLATNEMEQSELMTT
jgi:hypothetical protein